MNYLSVDMVVDAVEMLIGCGSLSKPVFTDRYSQQTDLITVGG
jgi:hypothetical protein